MELALQKLQNTITTGRLKDRDKMERRLGKIQARHASVHDLFEVALREGAYLLRSNLTADSAAELWSKYIQLTEAEASFRALKSELSIRPLFHQKEPRVKAHVMVAFSGLRSVDHAEALAEAASRDRSQAFAQRYG